MIAIRLPPSPLVRCSGTIRGAGNERSACLASRRRFGSRTRATGQRAHLVLTRRCIRGRTLPSASPINSPSPATLVTTSRRAPITLRRRSTNCLRTGAGCAVVQPRQRLDGQERPIPGHVVNPIFEKLAFVHEVVTVFASRSADERSPERQRLRIVRWVGGRRGCRPRRCCGAAAPTGAGRRDRRRRRTPRAGG